MKGNLIFYSTNLVERVIGRNKKTKQKIVSFLLFFFLEHTEKKLEVCINHTAVHDSSCSGNNSICLHTSKVTEISFNMFSTARALVGYLISNIKTVSLQKSLNEIHWKNCDILRYRALLLANVDFDLPSS